MQYDPCPETLAGGEGALGDRVELGRPCIGQVHKVGLGISSKSRRRILAFVSSSSLFSVPFLEKTGVDSRGGSRTTFDLIGPSRQLSCRKVASVDELRQRVFCEAAEKSASAFAALRRVELEPWQTGAFGMEVR